MLYILRGCVSNAKVFLLSRCRAACPICWLHLSPVWSKKHSEACCCASLGSSGRCCELGYTQDCRWGYRCLWACIGTLREQACGSAAPWWLRQLWTTSSSFLWKHSREDKDWSTGRGLVLCSMTLGLYWMLAIIGIEHETLWFGVCQNVGFGKKLLDTAFPIPYFDDRTSIVLSILTL